MATMAMPWHSWIMQKRIQSNTLLDVPAAFQARPLPCALARVGKAAKIPCGDTADFPGLTTLYYSTQCDVTYHQIIKSHIQNYVRH